MKELPIACSLSSTGLAQRLAQTASLGADAVLGRERRGGRHLLRFRADAEVERRLRALVKAELECCPFLELELTREGGSLLLTISAPPGGEVVAEQLAGAFTPVCGLQRVSSQTDRESAGHETEGAVQSAQDQHR